jgi:hypothetical protein
MKEMVSFFFHLDLAKALGKVLPLETADKAQTDWYM